VPSIPNEESPTLSELDLVLRLLQAVDLALRIYARLRSKRRTNRGES
jgi:hypothetical protein